MAECEDSLYDEEVVSSGIYDSLIEKYAKFAYVVAAQFNNELIGYAAFYCNDIVTKQAYLSMIVVKKEYQHIGAGNALMREIKRICCDNGFLTIKLEVDVNNYKAKNLYHKCGYAYESIASEHTEYFCLHMENEGDVSI